MALRQTLISFLKYNPGYGLQDGWSLWQTWNWLFSASTGLTAHAGGGQAGATPLPSALNRVDTVANAADSVLLPPAIPGRQVVVNNNSANALQVFGVASNGANDGAGDKIATQGSTVYEATGTGVAQASGVVTTYSCDTLGLWKQGSVS